MSSYELRYFPIRGRAEVIRFLLLASGSNFTYVTPKWPSDKDEQPQGQLPVLTESSEDGRSFVLSDSVAIEKYLAAKSGLLVTTGFQDTARENQLRGQMEDLITLVGNYLQGNDAIKESSSNTFYALAPRFVKYHEKILAENGDNGHYFGSSTTYVDIALYVMLSNFRRPMDPIIPACSSFFSDENAPRINKVFQTIERDPVSNAYRSLN